jgi:hypothetical protein
MRITVPVITPAVVAITANIKESGRKQTAAIGVNTTDNNPSTARSVLYILDNSSETKAITQFIAFSIKLAIIIFIFPLIMLIVYNQ